LKLKSAYEKLITQISSEIFSLNTKNDENTRVILHPEYVDNFSIYQNNLFYFINDKLKNKLIGTFKHMGKDNFRYFVRSFIIERGITSIIVDDVIFNFTEYVKASFEIHQDEILTKLMSIDLLHNGLGNNSIWVFEGMLEYWNSIITNDDNEDIEIDTNSEERIQKLMINSEYYLKKTETRGIL